jgi:alcohol dehydrogenase YqhD (iron-dependent ADH family)
VIDSAKAIGYGLANNCAPWDIYSGKTQPKAMTPVGAVLTIAAAGSEMSNSSVITNDENKKTGVEGGMLKRGANYECCRCTFALCNPELTYTLPWYQTACGATDIIMHTLERWFDPSRGSTELTDRISAGLIQTVMHNAHILHKDGKNYNARAEIMWASSLSHNGLTNAGGEKGDWACHQLEHELGGMFDVAHGAGLAAVWGSWARYVMDAAPARFAELGSMIFNNACPDVKAAALDTIAQMEDFFRSIEMPVSVHELGIDLNEQNIKDLAWKCSFFGKRKIGTFKKLDVPDMEKIYRAAK